MFRVLSGRTVPAARLLAPRGSALLESVRGRKSRSDPTAKSKVGRVKVPPPVDPVEMVVLRERFQEYDLIMRGLRLDFKEEVLWRHYEEERGSMAEDKAKEEVEEHRALMAWNQEENLRMLRVRTLRIQKETEAAELKKMDDAARREQEMQEFIREKEKEILQLQEEAKTFITAENLDQRIEDALDNPKNYNFAIDREGRVVKQTVLE